MKNDIVYKIPQIEIQKFFNLDNKEFQELKKQVGINTVEHLNQNNLSCMISFFRKVNNKDDIDIENFNLKLFEVKEHEEIKLEEIKDVPEPKKIKIYKEKKTSHKAVRPIEEKSSFIAYLSMKDASAAYNQDRLKLYYSFNRVLSINEKCFPFNVSKSFQANMKDIKSKFSQKIKIYLYSNGETYNKIERTTIFKKPRVWTPEEDEKILNFYNSDYYKNPQNKNLKNPYTMKDLCKDLKVKDKKTIVKRASELGFKNFSMPKQREYSDEEKELLKSCVGKYQTSKIQKIFKEHGYSRSIIALNIEIQRLKLSRKLNGKNELSLRMLAEAFGVDTHFFSDSKERINALNPTKTNRELIFTRENIKKYVIENPYDFNLGKVDNKFFIELLTGATNDNNNQL